MPPIYAAISARFSSENQRDASLDDQERLCRRLCENEGWNVYKVYADRAMSGSSDRRPGYQAMLVDARAGKFQVLVAEGIDRLSRDQADIATLHKQLRFLGIKIVTVSEGEINTMHIGLKGTMNAMYIEDLAQKTHRGLEGVALAGRNPGGRAYGYRKVRRLDHDGDEVRGLLEKVPEHEAVVIRIFTEFAAGLSPIAIARRLNADEIPGPTGKGWRGSTIRGHADRKTGILRNQRYVGQLCWNKQRYVKDPITGNRLARPRDPGDEVLVDAPTLRIIPQDLWDAVQTKLNSVRASAKSQAQQKDRFWTKRRPKHLFTGMVFCGVCGSVLESLGKDYLGCRAAKDHKGCQNSKTIRRSMVEDVVLDGLKSRLMAPDLVASFMRQFTVELNRQHAVRDQAKTGAEAELKRVERKLKGLFDAIADGLRATGLQAQLSELEAKQADLKRQIENAPTPQPRLHPRLADVYREMVADLHAALADPGHRTEAAQILRGLVDRIAVKPSGQGHEVELTGDVLRLLTLPGGSVPNPFESSVKVVAGAGFEPTTFRL